MPETIEIGGIPDALYRKLERLARLEPIRSEQSSVQMVEEARAERDAELSARIGIPAAE